MLNQSNSRSYTKKSSRSPEIHFLQYIDSSEFDLRYICRVCLFVKRKLIALSAPIADGLHEGSDTVGKSLTSVMAFEILEEESMPNQICLNCQKELLKCLAFREKCASSQITLKSVLNGEYVKEDLSVSQDNSSLASQDDKESLLDPDFEIVKQEEDNTDLEILKGEEVFLKIEKECDSRSSTNIIDKATKDAKNTVPAKRKYRRRKSKKVNLDAEKVNVVIQSKKRFICHLCSEDFSEPEALTEHVNSAHSSATFRCEECGQSFFSQRDLAIHAVMHSGELRCTECQKDFNSRVSLSRHILRHMQHKRHACARCGKAFSELSALRRHARVHTGQPPSKPHACAHPHCDKRFADRWALRAHAAAHSGQRALRCACGAGFRTPRLLRSHARVHLPHKPYKCDHCDQRFRHKSTRTAHHRTHTGERPYVCAACGRAFLQHSNLTLHMRVHSGEKPYSCKTCDRKFSSGSSLKNHMKTHAHTTAASGDTGGPKLTTTVMGPPPPPHPRAACSKTPAAAPTQPIHIVEKKFECGECHKKFATKSQLTKHAKTHVPKQEPKPVERQRDNPNQQILIVHRVTDDTPYNCAQEVIIPSEEIPESVIVDISDTLPIELSQDEEIPTHLCLTKNGINFNDLNVNSNLNLVTVNEEAMMEGTSVRLYQLDQSLLQIHSSGGQLTISKITSKMTANFE